MTGRFSVGGTGITFPRALVLVVVLISSLILQVTVLDRLGLPGATPDLVIVVVIGFALVAGPLVGSIAGFSAGLILDLMPPAIGVVGVTAAILAVIGYFAGHIAVDHSRPDLLMVGTVVGFTLLAVVGVMLVSAFVGSSEIYWLTIPKILLTEAIYSSVLAVGAVPLISYLYRGARDEVGI